jgi:hypothetical protein
MNGQARGRRMLGIVSAGNFLTLSVCEQSRQEGEFLATNRIDLLAKTLMPALFADSDEAGHAFQSEAGHLFQREAGRDSDLKPATAASFAGSRLMMSWVGFSGQA